MALAEAICSRLGNRKGNRFLGMETAFGEGQGPRGKRKMAKLTVAGKQRTEKPAQSLALKQTRKV